MNRTPDRLQQHLQAIRSWIGFIAQNEQEKLNATELVRNFDLDGGATTNYTEDFASSYSQSTMTKWPLGITSGTDGYFNNESEDIALIFGSIGAKLISNLVFGVAIDKYQGTGTAKDDRGGHEYKVTFPVVDFSLSISPVAQYDVTPVNSESRQFNRRESFSISMDRKSHLDFDVYRVKTFSDEKYNSKTDDNRTTQQLMDVFTNDNFLKQVDYDYDYLDRHFDPKNWQYARSFVYRTRGGATCRPSANQPVSRYTLPTRVNSLRRPIPTSDFIWTRNRTPRVPS